MNLPSIDELATQCGMASSLSLKGNCHAAAIELAKLSTDVQLRVARGHWVADGYIQQHSWCVSCANPDTVIDPTRWVFESETPYIAVEDFQQPKSPYDEGDGIYSWIKWAKGLQNTNLNDVYGFESFVENYIGDVVDSLEDIVEDYIERQYLVVALAHTPINHKLWYDSMMILKSNNELKLVPVDRRNLFLSCDATGSYIHGLSAQIQQRHVDAKRMILMEAA